MPKARKRRDLHFAVSPWASKKQSSSKQNSEASSCYGEVALPWGPVDSRNGILGHPATSSLSPGSCTVVNNLCGSDVAVAQQAKGQPSQGVASEWITKKSQKHSNCEDSAASYEISHWSPKDSIDEHFPEAAEECTGHATKNVVGEAYVVFMPSGDLTGHFIESSSKKGFGLMGKQILAKNDCMRDDDWKLIRLTVVNFFPRRQFTSFVEKKGGDCAILSPVDSLHEDEMMQLAENDRQSVLSENSGKVCFSTTALKCDEEAQEHLRQCHPKLVGEDVIVNIGEMIMGNVKPHFIEIPDNCGDDDWLS